MLGAAARLKAGNLVAFPTETVYGLGADASNSQAVARIYSVKGRPNDHPLIVHIASMERLGDWAREMPEYAIALARSFWPGPMTLILMRSKLAGDFITGGQDSVGLRVPDHAVALALLEAFEKAGGQGVAAPSANRFGRVSPTTAEAVRDELSDQLSHLDQIIDGGRCEVGLESTIIDCTGPTPKVLRSGAITEEMIEMATGLTIYRGPVENVVRVSGSLVSHYAPRARVILSEIPKRGQGFIALTSIKTPEGVVRLASPSSSREFAQVLYSALREADNQELEEVVVAPPDGVGIEIAIRDRVQRASGYDEFM